MLQICRESSKAFKRPQVCVAERSFAGWLCGETSLPGQLDEPRFEVCRSGRFKIAVLTSGFLRQSLPRLRPRGNEGRRTAPSRACAAPVAYPCSAQPGYAGLLAMAVKMRATHAH